jgi:drug/metabolite transporter (DMT)-like permease
MVAAFATCCVIWGTTWLAIRICIGPGGYPTMVALVLRFTIASAILIPLAVHTRYRTGCSPTSKQWLVLLAAGVLDAAGYSMVYIGEQRVTGGVAAVIYGTQPFLLAALLGVTKMERIWRSDLLGAAVAFVGVTALFFGKLHLSAEQAIGVVFVLGSVVCSTCYSAMMKHSAKNVPAVISTAIFLAVTALCLLPAALLSGQSFAFALRPSATYALFYLAIAGSVIAFVLYFWLLSRVSMKVMSIMVFVFPVIALVADAVWEPNGRLRLHELVAVIVILAGMAIGWHGMKQREAAAAMQ